MHIYIFRFLFLPFHSFHIGWRTIPKCAVFTLNCIASKVNYMLEWISMYMICVYCCCYLSHTVENKSIANDGVGLVIEQQWLYVCISGFFSYQIYSQIYNDTTTYFKSLDTWERGNERAQRTRTYWTIFCSGFFVWVRTLTVWYSMFRHFSPTLLLLSASLNHIAWVRPSLSELCCLDFSSFLFLFRLNFYIELIFESVRIPSGCNAAQSWIYVFHYNFFR